MDTLTQGLLGAAAAQALTQKRIGKKALLAGALGGMAADLDVFIYSPSDPMLGVTLHRHFTHALLFIPAGALIVALFLRVFRAYREDWAGVSWACFWGYATHGLLDACTSYGTMLLWPFSTARISWDCVSIVDPVFSGALIAGVVWAQWKRRPRAAVLALLFCLAYLGLGEIQNRRGEAAQREILHARGHEAVKARVMPTLANLVVWRSLYEADGRLWADTIRVPIGSGATYAEGASVTVLRPEGLPPGFLENPALKKDWEKFLWFTEGFVALSGRGDVVGDMRYSSETGGFKPLWGIVIPENPARAKHVGWTF
ncbi:MAG TPA: metal-dependent hydrolase [bacterium]|nr:metal-dependent hydrolase [bacterium]